MSDGELNYWNRRREEERLYWLWGFLSGMYFARDQEHPWPIPSDDWRCVEQQWAEESPDLAWDREQWEVIERPSTV